MTNYSLPSTLALQKNNNNSLANPQPAITHLHYIHTDSTAPITSSSTTSVIVINPIYNLLRVFLFWPPSKQHTTPDYTTMSNQRLIRRRCLNIDYAINCIPIGLLIRVNSTEQQSNPILIIFSITITTTSIRTKCPVNLGQKTRTWYSSMNHHSPSVHDDCLACFVEWDKNNRNLRHFRNVSPSLITAMSCQ